LVIRYSPHVFSGKRDARETVVSTGREKTSVFPARAMSTVTCPVSEIISTVLCNNQILNGLISLSLTTSPAGIDKFTHAVESCIGFKKLLAIGINALSSSETITHLYTEVVKSST
jgi:hypothetical protein